MPDRAAPRFELFPHDADVGVRGIGGSREEAFAQAARALTAIVTDPERVAAREQVAIACEAPDDELLLVDFLNALIFEMATRALLFHDVSVTIDGPRLRAVASGEAVDVARHEPAVEPKGATCTELKVARGGDGDWTAQCVVDV